MYGGSHASHLEDLAMPDATFATPDRAKFASLDELGPVVLGQRLEPGRAVLTEGRRAFLATRPGSSTCGFLAWMSMPGGIPAQATKMWL